MPPSTLSPGTRLGPYEILSDLGAGGMGEVYRARDSKLNRDVAIKVLLPAVANDPDRLARFSREAQVLASLNHPNIAAIYGLEDADPAAGSGQAGTKALVLELVEGPTLADRIAQGAIPIADALPIARQIADALEAAHEQGIIHRDLKPANIKVRPDGTVKVLDFGLAKAMDPAGISGANAMNSPTLSMHATQAGIILGTAAYMSPEQAAGKVVDKRSDLWAFGVVLLEMLTGRQVFGGETTSHVLAAVLKDEPNWTALPPHTPAPIRRLLRRCLEKDGRARLRDIGDARLDIDDAIRRPDSASAAADVGVSVRPSVRFARSLQAGVLLAGLLAGAAITWTVARPRLTTAAPAVSRLSIAPSAADALTVSGNDRDLAISPDGTRVVYVGGNGTSLIVRELDRTDPIRIEVTGLPHNPFFSPDGAWVGFVDGLSALRRVPVRGGAVETICRITAPGVQATWGRDAIVFAMYGALWSVPAAGGLPAKVASAPTEGSGGYVNPAFLPGGRAVIFSVTGKAQGISVFDLQTGTTKAVTPDGFRFNGIGGTGARYLDSGHLVYPAANQAGAAPTLRVVRFDLSRLQTIGSPAALSEPIFTTPFGRIADFDVSTGGTLVYVAATARPTARRMVWVSRDGLEQSIDLPVRAYTYPSIAPGGQLAAIDIRDQENDTWIWDVARNGLRRLTFDPGFNQYAVWTPDGRRVVHVLNSSLFWQQADGSGAPELLARRGRLMAPYAFSPDGRRLVFREDFPETGHDLMMLSLDGDRKLEPLLQTRFNELNADVSPDGRWLVYESDESGAREIYVRPFPNVNAGRWQISTSGGTMPLWARDGRELFFLAPGGVMMAAPVDAGQTFSTRAPTKLFEHRNYIGGAASIGRTYDISPDGRRFLMIKPDGPPASLVIVLNWFEELKRLVPTKG